MEEIFKLAVHKVTHSPSSIFTKDDVKNLLEQLQTDLKEQASAKTNELNVSSEAFNKFQEEIESRITSRLDYNVCDLIDHQSAEFNIEYNNVLVLENVDINSGAIADIVNDILLDEFQKHFGELEE